MTPRRRGRKTDPVELELFRHLLISVAEEMGIVLRKTAYSANIKERRDYSCAVYDSFGQTAAMGDHMPVHLGAMPLSVRYAIEAFELRPGDVVILNDPFRGGTHLPDITAVAGVWTGKSKRPSFYVANRAHHADVGGMSPGSMPLAREIYQEGIRIPPVLLVQEGRIDEPLLQMILANVRTPEERHGDLLAQLMAIRRGESRLAAIVARYGLAAVDGNIADLQAYSERMMRANIARLQDGSFTFEDYLEGNGDKLVRIAATIRIRGDEADVDFTGSDPQSTMPVNANYAIAIAATTYVFRCLITEDVPFTAGLMRPVRVIAPEGTVVNAQPPAAMAAGNVETSQRITDVLLGALAQAAPDRIPAMSSGTMNNLTFGGHDPRRNAPFAYYETIAGGMGGGPVHAGLDAVHTHMTNSWNTPVEAFERQFPVRIRRYEIRTGSGGAGTHAGGDGIVREFEFLTPADLTILSDRRKRAPAGLNGGEPGARGRNTYLPAGGGERQIAAKVKLEINTGDRLRIETPGGGAWSSPSSDRL